jgi:hypothetical protein
VAAGRERVLAQAGLAPLAAPDAAAVHRVAAAATAELLGLEPPVDGVAPPVDGVAPPVGEELVPGEVRHALASLRAQVAVALERLGCPLGQGVHFARPLDQFAVEALLVAEQARRARPAAAAPVRSRT